MARQFVTISRDGSSSSSLTTMSTTEDIRDLNSNENIIQENISGTNSTRVNAIIRRDGDGITTTVDSTPEADFSLSVNGEPVETGSGSENVIQESVAGTNSTRVNAIVRSDGDGITTTVDSTPGAEFTLTVNGEPVETGVVINEETFVADPVQFNTSEIEDLTAAFAELFQVPEDEVLLPGETFEEFLGVQPATELQRGDSSFNFIVGGPQDSILSGQGGSDTIIGNVGDDIILGGDGSFNRLSGRDGNDTVVGGSGRDTITGDAGDDVLAGLDGNDLIFGGNGSDAIAGGVGDDRLFGDAGSDLIFGGSGNDRIVGGTDADFLFGGDGNDVLRGGAGDDILNGGIGRSTLFGGAGTDTFAIFQEEGSSSFANVLDFNDNGELFVIESASFETADVVNRIELGQTSLGVDVIDTSNNQRLATLNGAQVGNLEVGFDISPVSGAGQIVIG